MKTVRINSQNSLIDLITQSLEETSVGKGLRELCNIEFLKNEYSTTMVFERKDGEELNPSDFLMLGYFVGRDFEDKQCTACENRKLAMIENIKPRKKKNIE